MCESLEVSEALKSLEFPQIVVASNYTTRKKYRLIYQQWTGSYTSFEHRLNVLRGSESVHAACGTSACP